MTQLSCRRAALLCALFLFVAGPASAGPTEPAVRAEIGALLSRLAASGCKFNRNGDWHDAAEASKHLQRKLAYLEDKGTVKSANQFIDLAATQSSSSGKPYLVQCPGEPAVPSSQWLKLRLMEIRKTPGETAR